MKLKAITIAALIFLAMIALGAVSASENMTQDTEEMLEVADDSSLEIEESSHEGLLGESGKTFTELNDKLSLNGSGTVNLDDDYSYNNGSSTDGIIISQELTINGNGHTIDAKLKSKIFDIKANNVVLKDITFVNANGGAVLINENNVTISNCRFVNCSSTGSGGAIYIGANDCLLLNCSFTDNKATDDGGAVYFTANATGEVKNCNFTDNKVTKDYSCGGAICLDDRATVGVTNSNFINNKAAGDNSCGGAVYFSTGFTHEVTNCNFINNSAEKAGAIRFAVNGTVVNCTFANNKITDGEGGAVLIGDTGTVVNCTFVNCSASVGGGAVSFGDGSVVNCTFVNCSASVDGGAVYFWGYGNAVNCNFISNNAYLTSGAIYFGDASVVTNCTFTNNSAEDAGGAIWFGNDGNVTDCTFTGNKVTAVDSTGGAICFGNDGNVTDCTFVNNSALEGCGGAICFGNYGNVTNCNFMNNSAGDSGGAVHFGLNSTGDVTDCNFTDNTAANNGGAIYMGDGNVRNCNFTGNNATDYGGAIDMEVGNVSNCNFTNNTVDTDGGAVRMYSGTVIYCTFINNKVNSGSGGAIWFVNDGNVTNCNFVNNAGYIGGAVYFDNDGNLTNCTFTDNKVTGSDSFGGAVYFYGSGNVTNCNFVNNYADSFCASVYFEENGNVTNCNFVNNSAFETGAVYFKVVGNVVNCNFTNNKAAGSSLRGWGGAIFFDQYTEGSVINCNFVNNTATLEGGAVYFDAYSTGTVTNCNFTDNTADSDGGAVYFEENGNVTNCNFMNNSAGDSGGAVRMYSGNVTDCTFTANTATENGGAILSIICSEVRSSRFLYNRANLGSAIYNFNYEDCVFISNNEPQVYLKEEMRKKATMTIDVGDIFAKQDQNVIINLSGGISANVTAMLNGTVMSVEIINGTGILNLSGLDVGTYNLIVVFNGTFEYNSTSANVTFSVLKSNSTAIIDVNDTYFGDDAIIVVTMPKGATGSVVIRVNEKLNFNKTIVDGRVSLSVPDLIIGEYTVQVSYDGDANYYGNMNTTYFEVIQNTFTRLQELINSVSDTLTLDRDYYGDGTPITISKAITIDGAGHILDAGKLSGIFNVSADEVFITNMTLQNANSTGNGGAIRINSGICDVSNCSFINNSAQNGGDVYVSSDSECDFNGCVFINSTADQCGGVAFIESNASSLIGYSIFINSSAGMHGGALFVNFWGCGGAQTSYFFNSTAGQCGGAFYFSSEGVDSLTDCNFTNCSAVRGGAVYAETTNEYVYPLMETCIFKNCRATDGGAIFSEGPVEFRSSTFTNDIASNGGAIYIAASGSLTVDKTSFAYCNAQGSGGALYVLGSADIKDSSFVNSSAIGSASVAYIGASGVVNFENSNFNNSVAGQDGAIYIAGSANILNCRFSESVSYFMYLGGGDISIYSNGSANIVNSSFTGSASSSNGGSIYIDNGSASVVGCSFTDSYAMGNGGAIYNQGELEVRGSIFSHNTAQNNGGAIYSTGEATAISSTFMDNTAGALGGAIYNCNYTDCVFKSNTEPEIYFDEELRKSFNMTVEIPDNIMVGDNITVIITVNYNINASLTVRLDGEIMPISLINGTGTLNLASMSAGDYELMAMLNGTYEYNACNVSKSFTVSKIPTEITIANATLDLKVNNSILAGATLIPVDVGNLTYTSSNGDVVMVVNGVIKAIGVGTAVITVGFDGNEMYAAAESKNITVSVALNDASVTVDNATLDLKVGNLHTIVVTTVPIDLKLFNITYISSNESVVTVDENGTVTAVGEGNAIITVGVGDDKIYARNSTNVTVTVSKYASVVDITKTDRNSSIIMDDEFVYGSEFFIAVTNNTSPVIVTINGAEYQISEGRVLVDTATLSAGKYTVIARIPESAMFNATEKAMTFTITRKFVGVTIETSNIFVDENETVTVRLNESIACNVTVQIATLELGGNFTDPVDKFSRNYTVSVLNGVGSISIPDLLPGYYTATAYFNINENYWPANVSTIFTVSKYDLNVSADFSNVDKTITITPASDITGNLTFIVDGKSYVIGSQGRTIDLSGLASGSYTYTISYGGDDRYNIYSTSASITLTRKVAEMTVHVSDINYGQTESVEVTLPVDATGYVAFILMDDKSNVLRNTTLGIVNGKATLQIPGLSAGKYNLNVIYSGSNAFESAENSTSFSVLKFNLNVNVNFINDDKTITVTPNSDIASDVRFIIANTEYLVGSQGRTIDLSSLENGNYTYTVTYSGDDKYNSYSSSGNITLSRISVNVTVEVEDIIYGETQEVSAVVPEGATSDVNFVLTKDGEVIMDENVPVVEGVASYTLPQLDAGTYTLKASYAGDSVYERSSFYEKSFSVAPSIDISQKIKIGDDGKIVIEVGNIKGEIAVYVDDVKDGSRGIKGKNFTYYLPTDEYSVGYHNLTFEYYGSDLDENVFKEWDNETQQYVPVKYLINITQRPTEKSGSDSDSDQKFTLVLKDDDGTQLSDATGDVVFTIMDEFANVIGVEVVKVVDGIANLDISKYKNGNYVISWSYSGDEKHTAISRKEALSIEHKAGRIVAGDLKFAYTESKWYSVTVFGNDGKPLTNVKTQFFAGGKLIGTATTNANGVASVWISHIPGTYSLTITAPGKTEVRKLTVDHIVTLKSVSVKRSAKKLVLTATLKKVNGKYLKGKTIAFKFNGKKMSAKTNGKGVAKVTVKKNILKKLKKGKKVTYQATYLKDTVKKTAKIK